MKAIHVTRRTAGLPPRLARAFFGRSVPSATTRPKELNWTQALCLPDTNLPADLQNAAEILLKSRWDSVRSTIPSGSGLLASGQIRKQIVKWESDLLAVEQSTDEYLATLRLIHLACIELGDFDQAVLSIARSGMTTSGKAREPAHLGASFSMAALSYQLAGHPQRAEEMASRALGIDNKDVWALLALLESYESQGRSREGLRVLRDLENDWRGTPIEPLVLGRKCFFHLELGSLDSCFRTLEEILVINERLEETMSGSAWRNWLRADVAAITWRIRQSERYHGGTESASQLGVIAREMLGDGKDTGKYTGFNGVFQGLFQLQLGFPANVTFLTTEDFASFSNLSDESTIVPIYENATTYNGQVVNDVAFQAQNVGRSTLTALQSSSSAFNNGREEDLKALLRIRGNIRKLGGLQSVRDVLSLGILIEAMKVAKETRTSEAFRIARALSLERMAIKPTSPQTWAWHAKLLQAMGDWSAAESAKVRATDLGLGQGGQFGE